MTVNSSPPYVRVDFFRLTLWRAPSDLYGPRCFAVAGPRVGTLPTELRQSDSLGQFKRRIKTHLFGLWDIYAIARSVYAIASPSVSLSVWLSVTRVDQSKTVEGRITKFSPYGSPIPLVFRQRVSSRNSEGFPREGALNESGVGKIGDFRTLSRHISETVQDRTKVVIDY